MRSVYGTHSEKNSMGMRWERLRDTQRCDKSFRQSSFGGNSDIVSVNSSGKEEMAHPN